MRRLFAILVVLLFVDSVEAQCLDFPPAPPAGLAPVGPPTGFYRASTYAVWQNYAADRRGISRPRVSSTVYGSFRVYDGQPYPFTTTHPNYYSPTVSSPASGG
jgi:hypothetical protein